jgi:hypothetical protein
MKSVPLSAKILGYSGVLPFALLAVLHFYGEQKIETATLRGFVAYSVVILSFLGGIRWGVASRSDHFGGLAPAISVVPSLWAFACLLWPDSDNAAWGLMAGFFGLAIADRWFPPPGGAEWMIILRTRLSAAVIACHGIMIASLTLG